MAERKPLTPAQGQQSVALPPPRNVAVEGRSRRPRLLSNKPPTPKSLNHQISEGSIVVVYIELGDVGLPRRKE